MALRNTDRPRLKGARIALRGPRPVDRELRLAIGRDPEFARLVGESGGATLSTEEVERWYERLADEPYGWIIDVGGAAVGQARLHRLEPANRRARFAIGIFSPSDWGRGLGTETTQLVLRFAFEELKLHRVDLRVLTDNLRAIALYERCGFVREGIERETVADGDAWRSDLIMSILEEEYHQASATWTA